MPIYAKIAKYYLWLISLIYLLVGLGALGRTSDSLEFLTTPLFLLGILAAFAGLVPERFIAGPAFNGFPYLTPLGFFAVGFAAICIFALWKIHQSKRLIYVWWSMVLLAILMAVDNIVITFGRSAGDVSPYYLSSFYVIHPILLLISVIYLQRGMNSLSKL